MVWPSVPLRVTVCCNVLFRNTEIGSCASYYHDTVFAAMQELRAVADELELNTAEAYWPFPTYGDLLFSI